MKPLLCAGASSALHPCNPHKGKWKPRLRAGPNLIKVTFEEVAGVALEPKCDRRPGACALSLASSKRHPGTRIRPWLILITGHPLGRTTALASGSAQLSSFQSPQRMSIPRLKSQKFCVPQLWETQLFLCVWFPKPPNLRVFRP